MPIGYTKTIMYIVRHNATWYKVAWLAAASYGQSGVLYYTHEAEQLVNYIPVRVGVLSSCHTAVTSLDCEVTVSYQAF